MGWFLIMRVVRSGGRGAVIGAGALDLRAVRRGGLPNHRETNVKAFAEWWKRSIGL